MPWVALGGLQLDGGRGQWGTPAAAAAAKEEVTHSKVEQPAVCLKKQKSPKYKGVPLLIYWSPKYKGVPLLIYWLPWDDHNRL